MARSGRRLRSGPIRYPFKAGVVSDSDPKGSTGLARRGTLAFLSVARRKRSVGQKMYENQTAFSVRTEIHCCEIKRGVYTTEQATGWRCHTLSVLLGRMLEDGMEMVPGRLNGRRSSKALCRRNLSSLAWLGEGSEFFWRRWV